MKKFVLAGFRPGTYRSFAEQHVGKNLTVLPYAHASRLVESSTPPQHRIISCIQIRTQNRRRGYCAIPNTYSWYIPTGSAVPACIWRNILIFHFASYSMYSLLIYGSSVAWKVEKWAIEHNFKSWNFLTNFVCCLDETLEEMRANIFFSILLRRSGSHLLFDVMRIWNQNRIRRNTVERGALLAPSPTWPQSRDIRTCPSPLSRSSRCTPAIVIPLNLNANFHNFTFEL